MPPSEAATRLDGGDSPKASNRISRAGTRSEAERAIVARSVRCRDVRTVDEPREIRPEALGDARRGRAPADPSGAPRGVPRALQEALRAARAAIEPNRQRSRARPPASEASMGRREPARASTSKSPEPPHDLSRCTQPHSRRPKPLRPTWGAARICLLEQESLRTSSRADSRGVAAPGCRWTRTKASSNEVPPAAIRASEAPRAC